MSTFFPLEDEVTCPLGSKLSGSLCGRLFVSFSLSSQHMKKTFLATGWITTIVVSLGRVQRPLLSLSVCQASFRQGLPCTDLGHHLRRSQASSYHCLSSYGEA